METLTRLAFAPFLGGRAAAGLFALRAIVGLAFVFHGYSKIQHPASWMTLGMGPHAFAPGWLQAVVAVVEFFGGMALIAGLATPLVAALIFCDMFVAIVAVHLPGGGRFVGGPGSYELPLVYLVTMAALILTGPGTISLDRLIASNRLGGPQSAPGSNRTNPSRS
jgi:putative oxidoreductase